MTYPTSLDAAEDLEVAINDFVTTLFSSIDAVQTTVTIGTRTNPQGQNLPVSGIVEIDGEIIAYTSIDSSGAHPVLMGCTRGFDGTLATGHNAGALTEYRWVARHHNLLSGAIRQLQAILGLTPQGVADDVAARITALEPIVVEISPAGTNWSFVHQRDRLLIVHLYELTDSLTGTYKRFEADIQQVLDLGGDSQVNVTLPIAKAGRLVAY